MSISSGRSWSRPTMNDMPTPLEERSGVSVAASASVSPPTQNKRKSTSATGDSPTQSAHAKRPKISSNGPPKEFSKAELILLQGAADILDTPLEILLEAATATRSSSSTSNTSNTTATTATLAESVPNSIDSSETLDHAPVETTETAETTESFALKLPDVPQRAKNTADQNSTDYEGSSNVIEPTTQSEGAPSEAAVMPWLFDNDLQFHFGDLEFPVDIFGTDGNIQINNGIGEFDSNINAVGFAEELDREMGMHSMSMTAPTASHHVSMDHFGANNTNITSYSEENYVDGPRGSVFGPQAYMPGHIEEATVETNAQELAADDREKGPTTTATSIYDSPAVTGNGSKRKKRGAFQDQGQREETGLTRRLRACVRCSMQRIRCFPNPADQAGCCLTCMQVARTRMHWLPCLRYKLSDAVLVDRGVCPRPTWSLRWKKMEIVDIKKWESKQIKTISMTQDVAGTSYDLKVRRYIPVEGDALERKWKTNGREQSFKCAPYAIANMKEAGQTLGRFLDSTIEPSICFYIDETDKLLRNTYSMAYRYSVFAEREKERRLLRAVLRLWCASRFQSRSDRICSTETLGMQPGDYGPDCPNSGIILVPPVLSAQMEIIMTVMVTQPVKKEVLTQLKELIQENQRRSWFTIYLTMFLLLHSCALLTAGDNKKARKQGFESRFFRTPLVESLHNGAKILLAYFHYCNKGAHPFSMDWTSPEQVARGELNAEQVQFLQETAVEVEKRAPIFKEIREKGLFEHDLYFLAQLYDRDWRPHHTI